MNNKIKEFWDKNISWDTVKENLSKYPNLEGIFALSFLEKYQDKQPFCIHPLTRWLNYLGRHTKPATEELESMICSLQACEGWKDKERLLKRFEDSNKFWDILSELEIGFALHKLGFTIKFIEDDNMPDIEAKRGGDVIYIEVYNFKKFFYRLFELELIIETINATNETLRKYDTEIRIERNLGITSNIQDQKIEEIVSKVIEYLQEENEEKYVLEEYPHIIYKAESNLQIVLYSSNTSNYNPEKSLSHVRYEGYLDQMLKEITDNKRSFKQLDNVSGIKIGVINVLFNYDFQIALAGWDKVGAFLLPETIDGLLAYAKSIDEEFEFKKTRYSLFKNNNIESKVKSLLRFDAKSN